MKWLLTVPHYVVLFLLDIAAFVVVAWFAILFTGIYPGGMFDFVEGGHPLEHPGSRLCVHPRHRPVPAVPAGLVKGPRRGVSRRAAVTWPGSPSLVGE